MHKTLPTPKGGKRWLNFLRKFHQGKPSEANKADTNGETTCSSKTESAYYETDEFPEMSTHWEIPVVPLSLSDCSHFTAMYNSNEDRVTGHAQGTAMGMVTLMEQSTRYRTLPKRTQPFIYSQAQNGFGLASGSSQQTVGSQECGQELVDLCGGGLRSFMSSTPSLPSQTLLSRALAAVIAIAHLYLKHRTIAGLLYKILAKLNFLRYLTVTLKVKYIFCVHNFKIFMKTKKVTDHISHTQPV